VTGPETPAETPAKGSRRPAILLVHGEEDTMIPAEALLLSANALAERDIPAQWHLSAGLSHGIDNAGLIHGGLFLAQAFGVRVDFGVRTR
jgi:phospholipase/carboxylesterase